jgi:hypothetical protein
VKFLILLSLLIAAAVGMSEASAQVHAAAKPLMLRYAECQKKAEGAGLKRGTEEYERFWGSCYPNLSQTRDMDSAGIRRLLIVLIIVLYWGGVAWLVARQAELRRHKTVWILVSLLPVVNLFPLFLWSRADRDQARGLRQ